MTALESLELHDGLIVSMEISYTKKDLIVEVELYRSSDDRVREKRSIIFEGVRSISQIADFNSLEKNAFAGNINYWVPCQDGTTFIYLTDGCIVVNASGLRVE
jgi:hypothetical protein